MLRQLCLAVLSNQDVLRYSAVNFVPHLAQQSSVTLRALPCRTESFFPVSDVLVEGNL